MPREARDWVDWAAFLLVVIQTGIMLRKPNQKRKKPSNRPKPRKRRR